MVGALAFSASSFGGYSYNSLCNNLSTNPSIWILKLQILWLLLAGLSESCFWLLPLCSHSDQWACDAESRPGEDTAVCHEHGDEEELHPGHPHVIDREVTRPQNPPCCGQNCRRVGEKQFSHGCQSGKEEAFLSETDLTCTNQWTSIIQLVITVFIR